MTNFYFIDSNIIIGYCNPLDIFHDVSVEFFREKDKYHTFLLFSVQEEFYRKMEYEKNKFLTNILGRHSLLRFPKLQKIINKKQNIPIIQQSNFLKYIVHLFQKNKITEISYTKIIEVFDEYKHVLRSRFNNLIGNWIKKPYMNQHHIIYKDRDYLFYYNLLSPYIHRLDAVHLSLACYEVRRRNRRNRSHEYYFYTNDSDWLYKNLNSKINIRNFTIKRINYRKNPTQKGFNPLTNSFNLDVYEYIPDNL